MGDFITGILERNEIGATYEGVVFDRFLTLLLSNGERLSIFDMGEPISTGLPINKSYEMILVISIPGEVQYFSAHPPSLESSNWQGTIIELDWQAEKGKYQRSRPELYEREWVLLATPLGPALMSPNEINASLSVGGFVQWKDPRLDLYAIV